MKTQRIRAGIAALTIAVSLGGLTGCAQTKSADYTNQQQGEALNVEARAKGSVDINFKTPPTLEDKAASKIDGVSVIQDSGNNGLLILNKDKTQIMRVVGGEIVWTSEKAPKVFENVKFVQEGDRAWIVATRTLDKELEVAVYDAYSYTKEQTALRKKTIKNGKAMLSAEGVVISNGTGIFRYYTNTGLMSKVNIPKGSTLLATTNAGYLISQKGKVGLATTSEGKGWNSEEMLPEGFTSAAKNNVVAFSSSVLALRWEEGNKKAVTFINSSTGDFVANFDQDFTGDLNKRMRSADSQPVVFVDNIAVDIYQKKITTYDKPIVGIVDSIVYLNDGTGKDLTTGKDAWKPDTAIKAPQLMFQRQGFYLDGGTVHAVNLRYVVVAPNASASTTGK